MENFRNKNILVVGGSSGIGLALVKQLLAREANVFTVSRREAPEDLPPAAKHLSLDITSDNVTPLQNFLPEVLHGLAYCPGTITLKPFHRLQIRDFQHDLEVNLLGAVKSIQCALPALKQSGGAGVILFSTVASRVGMNFHASIAAAKAAVQGLAVSLAAELAPQHIRVNVIAPSITMTPLAGQLLSSEQKQDASAQRHPLKRIGQPGEMAAMAVHLLSPDAGWITGQVIGVDGGMSTLRPI